MAFRDNGEFKVTFRRPPHEIDHIRKFLAMTSRRSRSPQRRSRGNSLRGSRQFAITKFSFVKTNTSQGLSRQKAHIAYIKRDGTGVDGGQPTLFGTTTPEALLDGNLNEQHQFRMILSPESFCAHKMNLEDYTYKVMERLALTTEKNPDWIASAHYNTNNPHVHIIMRGIDAENKSIRYSRDEVTKVFQEVARDVATEFVGKRTEVQWALAQDKSRKIGITEEDNIIDYLAQNQKLNLNDLAALVSKDAKKVRRRLIHLDNIGICQRDDINHSYTIPDGWMDELQRRKTCSNIIGLTDGLLYARSLEISAPSKPVAGIITKTGFTDEMQTRKFAILESANGQAFYTTFPGSRENITPGTSTRLMPTGHLNVIPKHYLKTNRKNGLFHATKHLQQDKQIEKSNAWTM